MLIDVHTHVVPEKLPDFAGRAGGSRWPAMDPIDACNSRIMVGGKNFRTVTDQCWSASRRLEDMRGEGVERQVLSPMPNLFSYWGEPGDTLDFSRFINGEIAAMVRAEPERFYGLGQVPLQDPDLAARELAPIRQMGLLGVEIGTNVNGDSLADPKFLPFFIEAEKLGMPIFIHAQHPGGTDRFTGPRLLENLIGFPQENTLAAATLISGGVIERCPGLRVLFSHGGGGFALVLPRLDQGWRTMEQFLPRLPSSYVDNFYFDTLFFDAPGIGLLIEKFGARRVMVGSDYPFVIREGPPGKHLAELAGLDDSAIQAIHAGSCLEFLGL
ncbi:MAG: amidohydrolase [SAR324 cluster bacterium]|nr:amidohydrolase [SAR324 cluster bacterium]